MKTPATLAHRSRATRLLHPLPERERFPLANPNDAVGVLARAALVMMPSLRMRVADVGSSGVLVFGKGFGAPDREDSSSEVLKAACQLWEVSPWDTQTAQ